MSDIPIAFFVLAAFFTLYVVASTWRSRDISGDARGESRVPHHPVSVDRRLNHWWRDRQRSRKLS
jgi:hypothetical protein